MKTKVALSLFLVLILPSYFISQEQSEPINIAERNILGQRKTYSKTHIIGFLASNNQYPLILQHSSALLNPYFTRGFDTFTFLDALYLNYQYNTKTNVFLEIGFKYLKYYFGYETNDWLIQSGTNKSFQSLYSTLSLDLGAGYSLNSRRNKNLVNLHTGLNIGFTDNSVGSGGVYSDESTYIDAMGNEGVFSIQSSYFITNRTRIAIYLGFSKDIKITENLFFTIRYNRTFGKRMTFSEHHISYSLSTFNIQNQVRANLTSRGQMYALGLRWYFK